MRTARTLVLLRPAQRPKAQATLNAADEALARLADGAQRLSPLRFGGYEQDVDGVPAGIRCAVYEADYAD